MPERIVLCTDCGQKNRVVRGQGTPRCGNCKKPLAIDGRDPNANILKILKWTVGIAVLGLVIYSSGDIFNNDPRVLQTQKKSTPPERVQSFTAPPVAAETGLITYTGGDPIAPLTIRTARGYNYFIRIVRAATGSRVMEVYIVGGETFEGELPLGSYEIRYASGTIWYGPALLFGPSTVYSKADRVFDFIQTEYSVRGYTIELIRQAGGNLHTSPIPENDF